MPFKSPEQEAAMFANPESRDVAKKWVKEYGHAPGWKEYNKKRRKKKSDIVSELVKIADQLDQEEFTEEANIIDEIVISIEEDSEAKEPQNTNKIRKFTTPDLPYAYNALKPYISEEIMKLHRDKHHEGYTKNLNKALQSEGIHVGCVAELIVNLDSIPESIREDVKNNGGGYLNHCLFWDIMSAKPAKITDEFSKIISKSFGSFDKFKKQFIEIANNHFNNGWIWLCVSDNELVIDETSDHDNPIVCGHIPILVLDMWEHAYYLQYKNEKDKYIDAWWNVIDWKAVEDKYKAIRLSNISTMKPAMVNELVNVADQLDQEGFIEEASLIDHIIYGKKKHKTPWGKEKFYRCIEHVIDSGVEPKSGDTKEEAAAAICGSVMWGPKSRKSKKKKEAATTIAQKSKCPDCGTTLEFFTVEENIPFEYCPKCEEVIIPKTDNRDTLSHTIPNGDYKM